MQDIVPEIKMEKVTQAMRDRDIGITGLAKAIFMHKVTNGEYLENISSLFVVKNNDNYNLRNNNIDYKLEKPKTNF
jgi:hypothetical protein